MPENGFLLITDISGYTAFLTQAELEHAHDILQSLFHVLLENIRPPLHVSKLEGDAIFCYAPDHSFLQGQTLLEALENLYAVFTSTRENMHHNTTCTCTACTLIPTLDLKMVMHYGAYIRAKIGSGEELSGGDVILVHRLLKNTVIEKTGVEAYAFLTQASIDAMNLPDVTDPMQAHTENYEHIGDVRGHVHDLLAVWERDRHKHRVFVDPDTCWFVHEEDIAAPPSVAWDYLLEPERRGRWTPYEGVTVTGLKGGRVTEGSIHHCAHGKDSVPFTIVDWKPFEYVTMELPVPLTGRTKYMTQLTPIEGGTRISWVFGHPTTPNRITTMLLRRIMDLFVRRGLVKEHHEGAEIIRQMIQEDIASGKLILDEEAQVAEAV